MINFNYSLSNSYTSKYLTFTSVVVHELCMVYEEQPHAGPKDVQGAAWLYYTTLL